MNIDIVMAALNQAIVNRNKPKDVIHHSDRMAEAGVIDSVGTTDDSYDNALAKTANGLYKSEVFII